MRDLRSRGRTHAVPRRRQPLRSPGPAARRRAALLGGGEARGRRGTRRAGMGCWRGFSFRTRWACASLSRSRIRSCGAVLPAAPAAGTSFCAFYGQVFVPQSWPGSSPCEVAAPPLSSWEPPRIRAKRSRLSSQFTIFT